MNLSASSKNRNASPAFTMIEIAIAIGVIAFALVAIIGILPRGLTVQKDNREDTIVNEDANIIMQAIRNGAVMSNDFVWGNLPYAPGLNFLTNYVDGIVVSNFDNGGVGTTLYFTNGSGANFLPNGGSILGVLSIPHFTVGTVISPNAAYSFPPTNYVRAWMRGISGSALEQNGANSAVAFRYVMDVQISPFVAFPPNVMYASDTNWFQRIREAQSISRNLYEVELNFHWPILANGQLGPNHQTYRSTISGHLNSVLGSGNIRYYAFQPQLYRTNIIGATVNQ